MLSGPAKQMPGSLRRRPGSGNLQALGTAALLHTSIHHVAFERFRDAIHDN
jgi:hypothetical protein